MRLETGGWGLEREGTSLKSQVASLPLSILLVTGRSLEEKNHKSSIKIT